MPQHNDLKQKIMKQLKDHINKKNMKQQQENVKANTPTNIAPVAASAASAGAVLAPLVSAPLVSAPLASATQVHIQLDDEDDGLSSVEVSDSEFEYALRSVRRIKSKFRKLYKGWMKWGNQK